METFEVISQIFLALLVCLLGFLGMLIVVKKEEELLKLVKEKEVIIRRSFGVVIVLVSILVGILLILKN